MTTGKSTVRWSEWTETWRHVSAGGFGCYDAGIAMSCARAACQRQALMWKQFETPFQRKAMQEAGKARAAVARPLQVGDYVRWSLLKSKSEHWTEGSIASVTGSLYDIAVERTHNWPAIERHRISGQNVCASDIENVSKVERVPRPDLAPQPGDYVRWDAADRSIWAEGILVSNGTVSARIRVHDGPEGDEAEDEDPLDQRAGCSQASARAVRQRGGGRVSGMEGLCLPIPSPPSIHRHASFHAPI